MTDTTPATTPTKENQGNSVITAAVNVGQSKKFEGEGLPFKAKLIGIDELSVDRDEKICLDSMFKLKALVRARGEHKQKIQINLTTTAVKIIDDTTKAQIATHEIERISFVVIDPRDTRAFGYIYNTADDRHQFWAIKTERAAAVTVLALKELFELAFEQYTKANQVPEQVATPATSAVVLPPAQTNPPQVQTPPAPTTLQLQTVPAAAPTQIIPVPSPVLVAQDIIPAAPAQAAVASILDDDIWKDDSSNVTQSQVTQNSSDPLFSFTDTPVTATPASSHQMDSLANIFGDLSTTSVPPTVSNTLGGSLSDVFSFSGTMPMQTTFNQSNAFYSPPPQPINLNIPPAFDQPIIPSQPTGYTSVPSPRPPPQQNLLTPSSNSPVAPATVSNPFSDFDFFGGLSSTNAAKPARDLFSGNTAPPKTIQQMQMEKQP